jgi:cytochrome oxidase Cu insertion factor (SCO1/SenC/PrrC family)
MSITNNLQTKNKFYYVVNPFEHVISNYEDSLKNLTKHYLNIKEDTPEILSSYAANIHADPRQWIFLTGSPHHITHFVKEVMMQPLAAESDGMPTHSTRLMIIDKNAMIRGYLDGNDPEVTQKILMKIGNLMRESS